MRHIYLIRHGQSEGSAHRCIGRTDLPLSTVGAIQAERLALWAAGKSLSAVYTSPLSRCFDTATILSDGRFPVIPETDLQEMDCGFWDGLPYSEIRQRWPTEYEARGKHLGTYPLPGGESFAQAGQRLDRCLKRLLENTCGDLAIVSHAGAIRGLLSLLLCSDPDDVFAFPQPWGGITRIDEENGRFTVHSIGHQPDRFPPPVLLTALLDKHNVPLQTRAHCDAVAQIATQLVHKISPSLIDLPLLIAACRLHDIARGQENHSLLGAKWLIEAGYPAVAALIASHHDLSSDASAKAQLLYLADKLVQGTRIVTLEERFSRSREKCRDAAALAAWQQRYDDALAVARRFQLTQDSLQLCERSVFHENSGRIDFSRRPVLPHGRLQAFDDHRWTYLDPTCVG